MPWARIPPDRLIVLPMFNIHLIQEDGAYLWYEGPRGKMRVCKHAPRIFFESKEDAHQAGAVGILLTPHEAEAEAQTEAAAEAAHDDEAPLGSHGAE